MKKLTKSEVDALSGKLTKEVNGIISDYNKNVNVQLDELYDNSSIKTLYVALINTLPVDKLDLGLVEKFHLMLKETLRTDELKLKQFASIYGSSTTIRDELIIGQIENENLESLIETIKNRFINE